MHNKSMALCLLGIFSFSCRSAEAQEKIPSVQELEVFAKEERRRRNLPLDCLAGACLGDTGDIQTEKVVTIAGQEMDRSLLMCGGQVVEIQVNQLWFDGPAESPSMQYDSGYFQDSEERVSFLIKELTKLRWKAFSTEDKTLNRGKDENVQSKIWYLYNPEKQGQRILLQSKELKRFYDWKILAVSLTLISTHPDKNSLCTPERQQGL